MLDRRHCCGSTRVTLGTPEPSSPARRIISLSIPGHECPFACPRCWLAAVPGSGDRPTTALPHSRGTRCCASRGDVVCTTGSRRRCSSFRCRVPIGRCVESLVASDIHALPVVIEPDGCRPGVAEVAFDGRETILGRGGPRSGHGRQAAEGARVAGGASHQSTNRRGRRPIIHANRLPTRHPGYPLSPNGDRLEEHQEGTERPCLTATWRRSTRVASG